MSDTKLPAAAPVGQYPYNLVRTWPDGRELHINYTPDNYTTRYYSNIGTGFEIDKTGRLIQNTVGNSISYTKGGTTSTAEQNSDSKSGGSSRRVNDKGQASESGAGSYSVTKGESISASGGASTSYAGKGSNQENITSGSKVEKVNGDVNILVSGDDIRIIKGNAGLSISGDNGTNISGNYTIVVGSKLIINAAEIEIRAGGAIKLYSTALTHNDVNISETHTHGGVMPGGARTDVPG